MKGRRLAILMWMHGKVRMRRYICTTLELISPLLFIIIVFCFKDKIKPVRPSAPTAEHLEIRNTDVLRLSDLSTPKRIFYTPDSKLTNEIMDSVGEQLDLNRIEKLPNRTDNRKGYYAFTNYSEIAAYVSDLYSGEAIVIFDDLKDRETWPERPRLNYTIRLRDAFFTDRYETTEPVRKPHRQFGTIYKLFMRIQWAIDTSFIKVLTGNNVNQRLSLQEFPAIGRTNDEGMKSITGICTVLCWMSLFLVFVLVAVRLMEERSTGIQELVKMVGVTNNLNGLAHFLNVLPVGLVFSIGWTILLKVPPNALIPHSDGFLIFIVLLLHFVSLISMAFACSYMVNSTQYASSLAGLAYIVLWLPLRLTENRSMRGFGLLFGLFPHMPLQWLWVEIGEREQYGEGLLLSDIMEAHTALSGPVILAIAFLLVHIIFFFALSWYLSHVRPGNYGQALPWNFLWQKQYWTKNEVLPESEADEEVPIAREAKYFEEPPRNLEAGISIENVSKMFPKHRALSNVSLEVYKGEITVLLGHNGAGKTTLMSIITGMISATAGRILVNGMDIKKKGDEVRMQMGLCPQHNLFFPELTVLEHVMFFTLLKGGSFKDARAKSLHLLDRLGLKEKSNVLSATLSGGMKRRLQLACALAGDANVLVLDEPTSGLDVETRRELWDLLLGLRGDRTVLLTTHFMEEADALGDRVAALHSGQLRCHATTMHLKKAIGTGYRLTFTTLGIPRDAAITDAVTSHVPEATLKEKTINSLSYNLPASASGHFPQLFTALEEKRSELGIETIGVGVSTLEEVFLKLCSDTDTAFNEDEVDTTRIEPTYNKVTGGLLYIRQFLVLLKRHFKYVWHKKIMFLSLQVMFPIILICVMTANSNNTTVTLDDDKKLMLDLDVYNPMPERKVLVDVQSPDVSLRSLNDRYPKVDFEPTRNISDAVLRSGRKDATLYNKYLTGIEINDTDVKALYTTVVYHAAPIALNLLSNALATRYIPAADGRTFTTYIHPVKSGRTFMLDDSMALKEPKSIDLVLIWCITVIFLMLATNTNSVTLPCTERATSSRHIHVMSGCPAWLHWAATCFFHMALCFVFFILVVAIAAAALDKDSTINQPVVILFMMLILTLSALAFFAFMYLVSFHFSDKIAPVVLLLVIVLFSIVTTTIKTASDMFSEGDKTSFVDILLAIISYIMPPHAATIAFGKCLNSARLNAKCNLNKDRCPNLLVADNGFDIEKCCAGENPRCYMCIDDFAPGKEMLILVGQFIVYMTLVLLTQQGTFKCVYDRLMNANYRKSPPQDTHSDEVVRAEAVYVDKQIALPKAKIVESNQAMLVNKLHKNYPSLIGKPCNAVKGISFSVKKGECFGLLGVNGAGKSTTFKMLTGEECPTLGTIYANGYFDRETQPYLRSLGYCPQFFGLDEFQTGRENLKLLLTLRGLDAADVKKEVDTWINIVGLSKYSDRIVSGYSGGCSRRLAAAAALATGAPVTLLDEPTSGVDVSARRRVWSALKRGLRQGRAVIITSHSMDEMEALCSRIAIMSGGVVRAVGTPSELRAHHAQGHAVIIKVNQQRSTDVVDGAKSSIERLKSSLQHKFNCTLKDEHKTMLHYHINETMRYSNLFTMLEELKTTYPGLVEDYSVTETTLEEVFLSFAKENQDTPPTPPAQTRNHVV